MDLLQRPSLLGFANQYCKQKKEVKARAFYYLHRCKHSCLKERAANYCLDRCEKQLDQFYEFKRKTKLGERVLFAEKDESMEAVRRASKAELECRERISKLNEWLNDSQRMK